MKISHLLKGQFLWLALLLLIVPAMPLSAQGDCTQTGLTNGGFEAWGVPVGGIGYFGSSNGWTSQSNFIEIWGSGFGGVPAYEGLNYMELNSGGPDIVYQDLSTSPGESYDWQVAHRGRLGVDGANLEFGPPGGPYTTIQSMSDGTSSWGFYSGTYTVPAGQTTTRVRLVSVSFSGGCPSCANFIDAFDFQAVDSDGDGIADCLDGCPDDPSKNDPGQCGCGTEDTDDDGDGVANCLDNCIDDANSGQDDSDCDGVGDACDVCAGGNDLIDNNHDGLPDCRYPPAFNQIIAAWKCGNNKVYVAHHNGNGGCNTICVSYNAVQAHLNHGDYLGPCGHASCTRQGVLLPEEVLAINTHEEFEVYPNPANNEINIHWDAHYSSAVLSIYDQLGRVVWSNQVQDGQQHYRVDLSDVRFGSGIYFIQINSSEQIFIQRFLIAK